MVHGFGNGKGGLSFHLTGSNPYTSLKQKRPRRISLVVESYGAGDGLRGFAPIPPSQAQSGKSLKTCRWHVSLTAFHLTGSNPYTSLKQKRPRRISLVVESYGAGDGVRTRECELGKLVPYHLATPAWLRIIRYRRQGVRFAFDFWLPLNQKSNNFISP